MNEFEIAEIIEKGGADPALARAITQGIAKSIETGAATKLDLAQTEKALKADLAKLKDDLSDRMTKLETKFDRLLWLGGLVGIPGLFASLKYLFKL